MVDIAHHILGCLAILETHGNPNEQRLAQELLKLTVRADGDDNKLRKLHKLASWRAGIITRNEIYREK